MLYYKASAALLSSSLIHFTACRITIEDNFQQAGCGLSRNVSFYSRIVILK